MATGDLRRPRWGDRTSLFQLRRPAFWLYALLVFGGALYAVIEQHALATFDAAGWGIAWLLALVFAVPMLVLVYVLDLYEREPLSLVLGAIAWGGLAAIALASIANRGWLLATLELADLSFVQEWGPAIVAPATEETLKGLGVVLIYLIAPREVDDLMDGFVYGAMIGLAFAAVENVFYFLATFAPNPIFGGDVMGAIFQGFFLRVVAGGIYSHVLWSGLVGVGVAYVVTRRGERSRANRLGVAGALVAVAMAGHFLWNSPLLDLLPVFPLDDPGEYAQSVFAAAVKGLPLLVVVGLMVVLARRRERRWLRAALASEVGLEGLTADELEVLESRTARKRRRADVGASGSRAARLQKRLERAQIHLAMIRTRVDADGHPDLLAQRRYCAALREQLAAATSAPSSRPVDR